VLTVPGASRFFDSAFLSSGMIRVGAHRRVAILGAMQVFVDVRRSGRTGRIPGKMNQGWAARWISVQAAKHVNS